MTPRQRLRALAFVMAALVSGCERLGIEDPAKAAAAREAEGKAVGAGCRHTGRSLEDCYTLNEGAPKAAVFAGWKEMNDYMVSNKMETVPSKEARAVPAPDAPPVPANGAKSEAEATTPAADKPARH
jgi:hypothetical protein